MSGRSTTKSVYFRDGIAYIRYPDERGVDVRERTKQRSDNVAEDRRVFPTRVELSWTACPRRML